MNTKKIREYFIKQIELVNAAIKDVEKYNATEEILNYVSKYGHCNLDGSQSGLFIRVEYGGAYAYLDVDENDKLIGNPIWWNNEDLGCDGLGYEESIKRLNEMTDEEIMSIPDVVYIDMDNLDVPIYVSYSN